MYDMRCKLKIYLNKSTKYSYNIKKEVIKLFNPYQAFVPFRAAGAASTGAIAKTGINWANLLSNTQKTLNIVNQAIPLVYQVKPIVNNAKTMFKIASEFGKSNTNNTETSSNEVQNYETNETENISFDNEGPNFFI